MSWQVLNSNVTITSAKIGEYTYQFSGVHDVRIKKSIHSIIQSCMLTIPSIGKFIPVNGSTPLTRTVGTMFTDGDLITIALGYNGVLNEEFSGFIKRRDLDMPLVVECEGYARQLRLNNAINANFTRTPTTVKALLELACDGTDITVQCDVDMPLAGIRLVNADGIRICDYIKQVTDNTLTVFFINATTLWCGFTYSAYAKGGGSKPLQLLGTVGNRTTSGQSYFGLPGVGYRIGFNTVKDNQLKTRIPSDPVQIIMSGKQANGTAVWTKSAAEYAARKLQKTMNHVPNTSSVKSIAQEKEYLMNYTGYEGKVTGFGVPFALPGYNAYITDSRYPELNGTYVIESTDVQFGLKGFRRIAEIGPMVGFTNTIL